MNENAPRIALPEPTSGDPEYNQRAWPLFARALESCGAVAVRIPLDEPQAVVASLASTCCGILLPGSPADLNPQKYGHEPVPECTAPDPAREAVDELLLQDAFNLYKPIFGVCYGLQSLNVWRNGSLQQHVLDTGVAHDSEREVQLAHTVDIAASSNLEHLLEGATDIHREEGGAAGETLAVNSSHHQAVDAPGDGLYIVARSPSDGIIEALEGRNPEQYVLGVQWHPERSFEISAASRLLFGAFVEAARVWQPRSVQDSVAS